MYSTYDVAGYHNIAQSAEGIAASLMTSRLPNAAPLTVCKVESRPQGTNDYGASNRIVFPITCGPGMGFFTQGSGYITGFLTVPFAAAVNLPNGHIQFAQPGVVTLYGSSALLETNTAGGTVNGFFATDTLGATADAAGGMFVRNRDVSWLIYNGPNFSSNILRRDQELRFNDSVYSQQRVDILSALACGSRNITKDYASLTNNVAGTFKMPLTGPSSGFAAPDLTLLEGGAIALLEVVEYVGVVRAANIIGFGEREGVQPGTVKIPFVWRLECPIFDNENHQIPLFMLPHGELAIQLSATRFPLAIATLAPNPVDFMTTTVVDAVNGITNRSVGASVMPQNVVFIKRLAGCERWRVTDLVLHYERRLPGRQFESQYVETLAKTGATHTIPFSVYQHLNPGAITVGQNQHVMNISAGSVNGVIVAFEHSNDNAVDTAATLMSPLAPNCFLLSGISRFNVKVDQMNVMQTDITQDQLKRLYFESREFWDSAPWRGKENRLTFPQWLAGYSCIAISMLKAKELDMTNRGTTAVRTIDFIYTISDQTINETNAGTATASALTNPGGSYTSASGYLTNPRLLEGVPGQGGSNILPSVRPNLALVAAGATLNKSRVSTSYPTRTIHIFAQKTAQMLISPSGGITVVS